MVLAATFAALGVIPILFLAQIAFIVAFGVLLDTLVVRSLLVPALSVDLGRTTWWPGRLSRAPGRHEAADPPEALTDRTHPVTDRSRMTSWREGHSVGGWRCDHALGPSCPGSSVNPSIPGTAPMFATATTAR